MRFALVLLVGCSTPVAGVVQNTTPVIQPSYLDLAIQPATFHYCCRGGGKIEENVALPAGRWLLRVSQSSDECNQAIYPVVMSVSDQQLSAPGVASTPDWAATLVDVPHDQSVRVRIFVEGGLHCCGNTTIDRVELLKL